MSATQLTLRVYLESRGDPYEVSTRLIDHNTWDTTRSKHGWPKPDEAPFTWLGFLAWAASRRTGQIAGSVTWDAFLADCLTVENTANDDEGDEAPADPTPPGPGPGSSVK